MRRILLTLLLLVMPGYSQTPPPVTPSVLTLNTLTVTGSLAAPSIKLGSGNYTLILPPAPPTQNSLLGIQSVTVGGAQAAWVKGFNGTLRLSASCSITVVNGLITGKNGC